MPRREELSGREEVSFGGVSQSGEPDRNWYMLAFISMSEDGAPSVEFDDFYDAYISDILRCADSLANVVRFSLPTPLTALPQVSGQVNFLTIYQLKKNSEPQGLESAILSPEHATAFAEFRRWKSEAFAYFDRAYYLCETGADAVVDALTKCELYLQQCSQFGLDCEPTFKPGVMAGSVESAGICVDAEACADKNSGKEVAKPKTGESIVIQFERIFDASPSGLSKSQDSFRCQLGGAERSGDRLTLRSWLKR